MNTPLKINLNKVTVALNGKLSIENREYERFLESFKNGKMGTQRLGQAFYDHFKLYRLVNQAALQNLYAKDGEHAKASILSIFDLT